MSLTDEMFKLYNAVKFNDFTEVERLLKDGKYNLSDWPNSKKTGLQPLLCLAKTAQMAELLISNGASLDVEDENGTRPLFQAAVEGKSDVIKGIWTKSPSDTIPSTKITNNTITPQLTHLKPTYYKTGVIHWASSKHCFLLFCFSRFEKWGRTDRRTTCAKTMILTGRDFGLAEWIKCKNYIIFRLLETFLMLRNFLTVPLNLVEIYYSKIAQELKFGLVS